VESHVLAIDIGGTKIAAALVDQAGRMAYRRQCLTEAHEGAEAILRRIVCLAEEVRAVGAASVAIGAGVGTGGWVDPRDGQVVYATSLLPGWTGLPLRARLEEALGLPTAVDNDVNVTGLAEALLGAGRGYSPLLCVAVGTGIGGAVIIEGRVYHGTVGAAGAFGHLSIDALHGRACNCGSIGCVEMYAAGPAILADWLAEAGEARASAWLGGSAAQAALPQVARLMSRDDEAGRLTRQIVHRAGQYLGYALVSLLHTFNPAAVVIGGGAAQVGEPFFAGIRQAIAERAMPICRQTPVLPAQFGADAALIGAAMLAWQQSSRRR
jgi:glucokinase